MKRSLFLLFVLALWLSACSKKPGLDNTILGTWANPEGYQIEFRENGKGLIPGVEGKVPNTDFVYTVVDEGHVLIDLGSEKYTIAITIEGDKLSWKDKIGEVVYTRVSK